MSRIVTSRRRAAAAVAAAVALAGVAGCAGQGAIDQQAGRQGAGYVVGDAVAKRYPVGQRPAAPRLRGSLLDGRPFDLASLRGRVVVVNFFGTWCAPCQAEAAELQQTYLKTKAAGVQFVGIDVQDEKSYTQAFLRQKGITYPTVFDRPGRISLQFRDLPVAIPTTVVIDRQARVAAIFRRAITMRELDPLVTGVAAERA